CCRGASDGMTWRRRLKSCASGWLVAASLVASVTSCIDVNQAFVCTSDQNCSGPGGPGTCESTGYCSLPAGPCPLGRRYVPQAGRGLAGQCVGSSGPSQISFVAASQSPPVMGNEISIPRPNDLKGGDLLLAVLRTDSCLGVHEPTGWVQHYLL